MKAAGDLLRADPVCVAPLLLGAMLTSNRQDVSVTIRLTEVEAYRGIGEDPGSHAHRRQTPRNASMFAAPGTAYVYFTYGMHWCLNIAAHEPGRGGAVLLRAGQVVQGVEVARARRPAARVDRDLARGPARLCAALGVDGSSDGWDLLSGQALRLTLPDEPVGNWRTSSRTGVGGQGAAAPWRFFLPDEPTVSPHRPGRP